MEQWIENSFCTGCAACESVCPKDAIQMPWDKDGYSHPVIDEAACIDCGACRNVCPVLKRLNGKEDAAPVKKEEPDVYAAWSKNYGTRYNSTSGGVFSEMALKMLHKGALISGAIYYGPDCLVKHSVVDSEQGLTHIRQSKYIQSEIGKVFHTIGTHLAKGKTVLFCGAPCQVAGLYAYLGKGPDNLITVDFICRGVNSPLAYRAWLDDLEKEYGAKATRVWFKNKERGWNNFSTRVDFSNGRKYCKSRYDDLFMRAFLQFNLFIRPSCTQCQFKGMPRLGDITLADFWKIDKEYDADLGTSMVVVNSDKGARLFEETKPALEFHQRTYEEALKGNAALTTSAKTGAKSREFFELIHKGHRFGEAFKIVSNEAKPLVSVVIPMIKRNKNLQECVQSICTQDYSRLEILLIRTTPDAIAQACCEEIAAADSRIRYISIQGDANIARNTAMSIARGDYIHFCTGNEILTESFYTKLIAQMESSQANIACFGWIDTKDGTMCKNAFNGTGNYIAFMDAVLSDCGTKEGHAGYGIGLWNKLFRRDAVIWDETPVSFETHEYGMTDCFWLMDIAYNSTTVLFTSEAMLRRSDSESPVRASPYMNLLEFFAKEAAALSSAENARPHIYEKLRRSCFDYEIELLISAKKQEIRHIHTRLLEHVLVFHEVPWSKKEVLDFSYQNAQLKEDRTFLKNKVSRLEKEVADVRRQLKKDRTFLKKKLNRRERELADLYSSKLVRIALRFRHLFRKVRSILRNLSGRRPASS